MELRVNGYGELNRRLRIDLVRRKLNICNEETQALTYRLCRVMKSLLSESTNSVTALVEKFDSLSPLKVLARGYSITFRLDDGKTVTDSRTIQTGEKLRLKLAKGELIAQVTEKM
jgi:exodeoxyribonuclease VII large subunit